MQNATRKEAMCALMANGPRYKIVFLKTKLYAIKKIKILNAVLPPPQAA